MKNMSLADILLLFFFVFSMKSSFLFGVANADHEAVRDVDDEEVQAGVEYYIISAKHSAWSGGIDLGSPINLRCPKFVIERRHDLELGRPVTFWPADDNATVIYPSTDLSIVFVPGLDAYCRQSTQWKLDDYDPSSGKWWVTTGANRGEPGPNSLTNWFKIEKLEKMEGTSAAYKFRFCPSVCESCVTLCNDVDLYPNVDLQTRLALSSHEGWPFHFVKVSRVIKQVTSKN